MEVRSKLETRPFSIAELAFGILPSCRVAIGLPSTVLDPPGFEMGIWPANDNWSCPEEGIWILRRLPCLAPIEPKQVAV